MGILWNILGGVIAGLFAAFIYSCVTRPKLNIALCPQKALTKRNNLWVEVQRVWVTNDEPPRFLRRFLRRNDAHSCHAWLVLLNPPNGFEASFGRAVWLPVDQPPHSVAPCKGDVWLPSSKIMGEFIDISSGGAAEIAIVEKIIGEEACYIGSWRLPIGKYILEVEVKCSSLPQVSKKFLLENKGMATDLEGLAKGFELKEI